MNPLQPANYYARALRAIGQDIADLLPVQLEIEEQERTFNVRLRCDRRRSEAKSSDGQVSRSRLGAFFHKLANHRLDSREKPELADVVRSYEPGDISRVDQAGMHRRMQVSKVPDIHSLAEILRTIGRIIDADEGRLTRLFKDQKRVIFDYVARGGKSRKVEMTMIELYKVQQSYYHARSAGQSLDLWKGKS